MRDEILSPEPSPDDLEPALDERVAGPNPAGTDVIGEEGGLRPRHLDDFVGQRELKEHLGIILEAARRRGQSVDHLLFAGPPGLGKTTLAQIIARELGVNFRATSGPVIAKAGDGMARWREHLFAFMARNASPLPDFFRIPRNRIVELGAVVEI